MTRLIEGLSLDDALGIYKPRVAGFLSKLASDQADVDDLTQETMLRLSRGWDNFRGDGKLSSWILQIASNVSIDFYRRRSVRPVNSLLDVELLSQDGADFVEAPVEKRQMSDCVMAMMDTLPESYARVLVQHDMEGFKLREIAQGEGSSVNAVKVRLLRARKRFRKILESACDFSKNRDNVLLCEPKEKCNCGG
ncbi:MAG: RNA polymerase sigma factor [Nitrospinae bacterium]|nr:RNA polymerase sigma factor [Nitrospinota bacterium]